MSESSDWKKVNQYPAAQAPFHIADQECEPEINAQELNVDEFSLTIGSLAQIQSSERATQVMRDTASIAMEKLCLQNPAAYAEYMKYAQFEADERASGDYLFEHSLPLDN